MADSPSPLSQLHQEETRSIAKAAGLIGAATLSSRILGFIRDIILAKLFGATASADAFFVAFRVPSLLRELVAEGSMSSAFIPVFTEYHTQKTQKDTWELVSAAFTTLLTIVTVLTLIGIMAAPGIVWVLGWGFHDDPQKLATTTLLTQIMFPYLLFISLAALAMGILNSLRAFAAPALAPMFFNVCVITAALGISPFLDEPVLGIAMGVVAGGIFQFLIQLPGIQKRGFAFKWNWNLRHPGVRQIGTLMVPTLLGLSVTQINLTVSTILASSFPGGPTYLFYGMRLIQFPLGIFGIALATAILPTFSAQAARGDHQELRKTLEFGLRMIWFIILPAMLGLILLRIPIIHLFFEHGAFSPEDTRQTAAALFGYAVGLWAFAGVRIIVSAFYSMKDTKTPALTAFGAMFVNIALSVLFMGPLRHVGLALATAVAAMVNISILFIILNNRLGGIDWGRFGMSAIRTIMASIPLVVACVWVEGLAVWVRPDEWIAKSLMLVVGIGLSLTGYIAIHALFRSEELDVYWQMIRKKMYPSKTQPPGT